MKTRIFDNSHFTHGATHEYVSIIALETDKEIDESYNGKPIFWLHQRINIEKAMFEYYGCPGGHIEEKDKKIREPTIEAAQREFSEETGEYIPKDKFQSEFCKEYVQQLDDHEKGVRHCYIFSTKGKFIMDNIEPKNHSEWKLYTFQEVLSMKCIDDFEEYIRKTIQRLVQHKNFWIKEGAIAQGKSFLQKYFPKEWKEIPEVTVSKTFINKEGESELTKFYEYLKEEKRYLNKEISEEEFQRIVVEKRLNSNIVFQEKIEKEYFKVLCDQVLFDEKKEETYVWDRSQQSTTIFARFNGMKEKEIQKLKSHEFYFDEIIKRSVVIYIYTSVRQTIQNEQKRKRLEEKDLDIKYLRELKERYYSLMIEAYGNKPLKIRSFENFNISETNIFKKLWRNIDPKKEQRLQKKLNDVLENNV